MRGRPVAAVVAAACLVLLLGYAGKACRGFWHDPHAFLCHSDVRALYSLRGMDRDLFPYVNGRLLVSLDPGPPARSVLRPVDGANEYPVLVGLLMWLPSPVVSGPDGYLAVSALLLAPFGIVAALLLAKMTGPRAILFAAAPTLALYAFHNWDLPAVLATTAAVWWWWRDRPILSAVALGLGGALKLYPLLLLVPLALDRRDRAGTREALRAAGAGIATFAAVNLPILVADPPGWAVTYRFQTLRPPNYDSLWGALSGTFRLGPATVNLLSTVLVLVCLGAVLAAAEWRRRREGVYPFLQTTGALIAAFLVGSKVHSPQYALWLLPWFALLGVRLRWWVLFVAANLVLYVAIFGVSVDSPSARDAIVTGSVWVRTVLFALLAGVFLGSSSALEPRACGPLAVAPLH